MMGDKLTGDNETIFGKRANAIRPYKGGIGGILP